jgi:hypothetical protein
MNILQAMPGHARVWIYQADRILTNEEVERINKHAGLFIDDWTSHGHKMNATLGVLYNLFIVIALDEQSAPASGCGIDKSVGFIRQLERELGVSLLDRMNIAYWQDEKIMTCRLPQFENLIKKNSVNSNTIVFNNMANTIDELKSSWQQPVAQSWHSKLLS